MTFCSSRKLVGALSTLCALAIACGSSSEESTNEDDVSEEHLIKGVADNTTSAVGMLRAADGTKLCTATLVAPDQVLTVAHCLDGQGAAWDGLGTANSGVVFVLGQDARKPSETPIPLRAWVKLHNSSSLSVGVGTEVQSILVTPVSSTGVPMTGKRKCVAPGSSLFPTQ